MPIPGVVKVDSGTGRSSFLETLRAERRELLSQIPCFESTLTFEQACERVRFGFIPRSFIFVGVKDIVDIAMARSVRYLDRADGILDRDDLYNQAYLMVLEQFERWNPWTTTFRKYLLATLPLRLRKYIDSVKYHGKDHRKAETAVKPSEFSGDFEEDGDAGEAPQTISVQEREKFSENPLDVEGNIFVEDLLSKLPDRHRKIIRAYILEEKTSEQVANELGVTRSVINEYVQRILKWLKQYLEDPEHTPPFQAALTKEEKVVSKADILAMCRFFAEHSCTEDGAYNAGFPRRVWRKTKELLRKGGYFKTKSLGCGRGSRSYLTAPLEECLNYLERTIS